MTWDGHDRRSYERRDCCDGDMRERVTKVEAYMVGHAEKIGVLTSALEKNNLRLDKVCDKLTDIKVQQ
jgi:hypothetical protein